MEMERLVTALTAVGSQVSAESEVFMDFFWPILATFVVREPRCYLETLS